MQGGGGGADHGGGGWNAGWVGAEARSRAPRRRRCGGAMFGDLASNLGIGRPLACVTGWTKKVGSIKVF